jgi:hypothetical protein
MSKSGREPFEALFEQARGDAFTPAELDRLWQGVAAGGGAGGGPGPEFGGAGRAAGYAGPGAALKVAAVVVAAVGIGIAGLAFRRAHPSAAEERAPLAATPVAAEVPSIGSTPAPGGPPTLTWDDLPKPPDAPAAAPRPQRPHAGIAPAAEVETTATIEAIASAPETPDGPLAAPTAPSVPATSTGAAGTGPAPSEGALLLHARRSLASDPGSALALTDEDARRFPAGPLAPEREVLAVEALVELRRLPEARTRLAAFRARYPQSPHLARLDALLGQ